RFECSLRSVAQARLHAKGFVEHRSESTAKDRVYNANRHAIRIAGSDADISNRKISLRSIGLIDQEQPLSLFRRCSLDLHRWSLVRGPDAQHIVQPSFHLLCFEVACDGEDSVSGRVVGVVELSDGVAPNLRQRNFVALFGTPIASSAVKIS